MDVVEKVWASVASNGTVIRAEVTGSIIARCFLAGNPMLTITLNSPLCTTPLEGKVLLYTFLLQSEFYLLQTDKYVPISGS